MMPIMQGTVFFSLVNDIAAALEIALDSTSAQNGPGDEAPLVATFSFVSDEGYEMELQLGQENSGSGVALRASLTFFLEGIENDNEGFFAEAFLACRLLPETPFPLAPGLLPDGEFELQIFLPWDEALQERLFTMLSVASSFCQYTCNAIRDLGFTEEITSRLQAAEEQTGALWNEEVWQNLKKDSTTAAGEHFSAEGLYYRWVPATEEAAGMVAIHLGSFLDFVGLENNLPLLLKMNALTFLSDHYYVGLDVQEGLTLIGLLLPNEEEAAREALAQLLEKAVELRNFLIEMATLFEKNRVRACFKNRSSIKKLILD